MASIKTAISIKDSLYKDILKYADKHKMSKSQFFAQSAEYMLKKDTTLELTKKMNEAITELEKDTEENNTVQNYKKYYKKSFDEKW